MEQSGGLLSKMPVLTLDGAKYIAEQCVQKANAENWKVIIVVTDASGHLKYLESMDGVQLSSIDTATQKAKTAVMYRRPSKAFQDMLKDGATGITQLSNMMPFEGGLPIIVDDQVIGAVGVSGVKPDQDGQIAQAGINAFSAKRAK